MRGDWEERGCGGGQQMVWRPVGHRQDLGIYRVQPKESSLPCAHLWCYLQTQRSFAAPPGPSLSSPPSHLCASAPQSPLPGFTRADTQRPGEHLRGARPYRGAGGTATKPLWPCSACVWQRRQTLPQKCVETSPRLPAVSSGTPATPTHPGVGGGQGPQEGEVSAWKDPPPHGPG